jgi:hypothetical protein
MRFLIALLVAVALVGGNLTTSALATTSDSGYASSLDDQQTPSGRVEVDINTDRGGGAWYTSPMWIAIGAIALVLLILLIVMATRGGGTTVVKE